MKTMKYFFRLTGIVIVLMTMAVNLSAQVVTTSTTGTAAANIIAPLLIQNDANMDFGNLAVQGSGGTATLTPALATVRSSNGGVSLVITTPGQVKAAAFSLQGEASKLCLITLPAAANVVSNGSQTMDVDSWLSDYSPTGNITLNGSGFATFYVGATIHALINQAPGLYTSLTPFTITVNYQ